MQNKNKKVFDKLVSRTKIYLVIIIILTVVFCVGVPLIQYIFSDNINIANSNKCTK